MKETMVKQETKREALDDKKVKVKVEGERAGVSAVQGVGVGTPLARHGSSGEEREISRLVMSDFFQMTLFTNNSILIQIDSEKVQSY